MGQIIVVPDAAELAEQAAEHIATVLRGAVLAREVATAALAGGSTPRASYERLAELALPWERVALYLGDERCVALDDPARNDRMVREALLERLEPGPTFFAMHAEDADRDAAAEEYGRVLPAVLDLVVLGIGTDGHTASLFPKSLALGELHRRVVAVEGPKPPAGRLTITPAVLEAARSLVVLAAGSAKARAVARAFAPGSADEVPARLARAGTWILDQEAAAHLGSPEVSDR